MTQKVIALTDFGAAENMRLIEADIPTPGPGQIVVRNKAIGLNYLDLLNTLNSTNEKIYWNKYNDPHPNQYAHNLIAINIFENLNK